MFFASTLTDLNFIVFSAFFIRLATHAGGRILVRESDVWTHVVILGTNVQVKSFRILILNKGKLICRDFVPL